LLAEKRLLRGKNSRVKILGDGALTKPLTIKAHGFSAAAKVKIEACGGKVELLGSHA
ncbi:MAG TPA: uL15m family ribosomal protein, partial [Candidatus Binatia bacterium]|nr:uL15m family ribosomal protein [Candidatus Binatia bacterium]